MAINVQCKQCGKTYKVADDKAGKRFKCRECSAPVQVPATSGVMARVTAGKAAPAATTGAGNKDFQKQSPSHSLVFYAAVGGGTLLLAGLIWGAIAILGGAGEEQDQPVVDGGQKA